MKTRYEMTKLFSVERDFDAIIHDIAVKKLISVIK